jgi:WhiB family transcriptional regulator, redox-sensing transcriptional regulator
MNWRAKAAGIGQDIELFFPSGTTGPVLVQVEQAKNFCRRCKVATQCLEYAIETGQDGIWGGMTEDERRALRRVRYRRPAGT